MDICPFVSSLSKGVTDVKNASVKCTGSVVCCSVCVLGYQPIGGIGGIFTICIVKWINDASDVPSVEP